MVSAIVPSQSKTRPRTWGGISMRGASGVGEGIAGDCRQGHRAVQLGGAAGMVRGFILATTSRPGSNRMKLPAEQFEKLALEQMDTLYRVAGRLTRDADRAADLVQETYLRAFRSRDAFELQEHGIRPWLLRIMRNLHLTKADRDRRQPVAVDGETLDAMNAGAPSARAGATGGLESVRPAA